MNILCTWRTPIVQVIKKGKVRICGDYKITLSKVLKDDEYPVPRLQEMFVYLKSGKYFCSLDIRKAYMNLCVDERSAQLPTISTHRGAYDVHRLMVGKIVAPQV